MTDIPDIPNLSPRERGALRAAEWEMSMFDNPKLGETMREVQRLTANLSDDEFLVLMNTVFQSSLERSRARKETENLTEDDEATR